jgi:hypothetical protein
MSILQPPLLLASAPADNLLGTVVVSFAIGVAMAFALALFRHRRRRPLIQDCQAHNPGDQSPDSVRSCVRKRPGWEIYWDRFAR